MEEVDAVSWIARRARAIEPDLYEAPHIETTAVVDLDRPAMEMVDGQSVALCNGHEPAVQRDFSASHEALKLIIDGFAMTLNQCEQIERTAADREQAHRAKAEQTARAFDELQELMPLLHRLFEHYDSAVRDAEAKADSAVRRAERAESKLRHFVGIAPDGEDDLTTFMQMFLDTRETGPRVRRSG